MKLLVLALKLATEFIGFGPIQRVSGAGQCQMLFVTGPEYPVWNNQRFTACGSLCRGWVCDERTKVHTKVCFSQHRAQKQARQRLKAPGNPPPSWNPFVIIIKLYCTPQTNLTAMFFHFTWLHLVDGGQ